MPAKSREDKRTMQGWGRLLGDPETQVTFEEAQLVAQMAATDRLYEMGAALIDLQARIIRMECWLEDHLPGYGTNNTRMEAPTHDLTPTVAGPLDSSGPPPSYRGPRRFA